MKKILLTVILFLQLMPTIYAKDILKGSYMAATTEEPVAIYGCTDNRAKNYDQQATVNRGCEYWKYGCTDEKAINYDPDAERDDGSCLYPSEATIAPDEKEKNIGKVVGATFGITAIIGGSAYYIVRKKITI